MPNLGAMVPRGADEAEVYIYVFTCIYIYTYICIYIYICIYTYI